MTEGKTKGPRALSNLDLQELLLAIPSITEQGVQAPSHERKIEAGKLSLIKYEWEEDKKYNYNAIVIHLTDGESIRIPAAHYPGAAKNLLMSKLKVALADINPPPSFLLIGTTHLYGKTENFWMDLHPSKITRPSEQILEIRFQTKSGQ